MVVPLVPRLHFDLHLLYLVLSQWLVFGMAWLVFAMLGRRLQWSRSRIGALTLVAGLGNTSFVGYPLIEALRGQEGLARSEEHTSELQSLMRISYAVFCLKKKKSNIYLAIV